MVGGHHITSSLRDCLSPPRQNIAPRSLYLHNIQMLYLAYRLSPIQCMSDKSRLISFIIDLQPTEMSMHVLNESALKERFFQITSFAININL